MTDSKRLQQVLKNLLSNAFKFTSEGEIRLRISKAIGGWTLNNPALNASASVIAFEVKDSGIGIPVEKQKIIFEAFQQADASTSRKFGGTGLGLAISRELATLIGGEIQLRSTPGEGSTFTLYLPQEFAGAEAAMPRPERQAFANQYRLAPATAATREVEALEDDRLIIAAEDKVLLIVEDDPLFAKLLLDNAHQQGFKALATMRGSDAIELTRQYRPTAISLDVFLPDMLGWTVLSQLKQNPLTRHIPVQVTTIDDNPQYALSGGAYSFFSKTGGSEELAAALARLMEFASLGRKRLLVVEDSPAESTAVTELLGRGDIDIVSAATGGEALALMRAEPFHCVVLDLTLPDMTGFEVLQIMNADDNLQQVPVVVFTGRELTPEEDRQLNAVTRGIVVKGVESSERLLYHTSLFLHRDAEALSPAKRKLIDRLSDSDSDLVGRTALLVDDDARNIFALSSVLERRGMHVLSATTGKEALEMIRSHPSIAIVLMDIMMPEMDGYETIIAIRHELKLGRLPIIALTAKAMKGDREKCLLAGASEYLAKPVNTEQLLESLRMWLHR